MPYRIDLTDAPAHAYDRLVDLGALDIEAADGTIAAIVPDTVTKTAIKKALGAVAVRVSPARGRDDGSVWVLGPRPVRLGALTLMPADAPETGDALRLVDSAAFGTGLHPTTALCVEALIAEVALSPVSRVLDVGTGSGVLALAALRLGVADATAIDIDDDAIATTTENAALNGLSSRLNVLVGGPESLTGGWPLVLANVLAAPLIEMAPALSQRIGHEGRLVLSGIPSTMADDVVRVYRRLGMHHFRTEMRDEWAAIVMRASW
jgi:ribosomal protein L11 methyltransferase